MNIWSTAEADAWGRDFDYADYMMLCERKDVVPFSERIYYAFKEVFNAHYEEEQNL